MHKLSEVQHAKVKGISAFMVQHECQHLDGKTIYDIIDT
jgi:peptide deformylase